MWGVEGANGGMLRSVAVGRAAASKVGATERTTQRLSFGDVSMYSPSRATQILHNLVESAWFRGLSLVLIVASAAILGLETSPSIRASYGGTLKSIESGIITLFMVELGLRIAAYGRRWPNFFSSGWNIFDAVVVLLCLVPSIGELSAVARLARVLRALRLVSFLPNLQLLVEALLKSFASMGYVALLLSLVFYVYGIIGVSLFAAQSAEYFGSLGVAIMTLFQILTLEGWVDVMAPQQEVYPLGAPLFFVSFIVLGTMIVLNLFIGVIVNGMSEAQSELLLKRAEDSGDKLYSTLHSLEEQVKQLRSVIEETRSAQATSQQRGSSEPARAVG